MDTTIKEALNEFFKLKRNYETKIMDNKKKIINNPTLSNREKRSEYLKLKPKCVNCQRPGGSKFKITFFSETDKDEAYRQYSVICGIVADPCNLDIKIHIGKTELLPNQLNAIEKEIKNYKNEVIDYKNKLLFGYLSTENVLEKFEELKDNINHYTSLYEVYFETYNIVVDNEKKERELEETITEYYIHIEEIKNCIKKMNETNNVQYARDAVNIYTTILDPLLNKIRSLKYNETMVWQDENLNTCNLIQTRYSISNLLYTSFRDKVISYNVGLQAQTKKNPLLIIETDEVSIEEEEKETPQKSKEISYDEPKYVDGGVKWNNLEYQQIWNKMPVKLKNILITNREWMKEFLFNCVSAKAKGEACKFTAPKELIIPPEVLPSGEYNFGVKIYSDVFNKLPKTLQETYLTFYSLKDGVKNYNMLIVSMNSLIEKEVEFKRGFF